jgi:hypothetical protein
VFLQELLSSHLALLLEHLIKFVALSFKFLQDHLFTPPLGALMGAASAAAVLSIARVFDADASGGVCSITSTT